MKLPNDQIIEVTIKKIVPNGFGLGFAENLTVFVSLAAAGDRLRVRVKEKKGKIAFAEIVEILEPSPDRIAPPCRYFGTCGGCDFQHLNYAAQLAAKIEILRDCLTRIGKIELPGEIEIIPSSQEFGYRARAQWHAQTRRGQIGYYKRNSHEIIEVEECPILAPELQKTLTNFRETLNFAEFWAEKIEIEAAVATGGRVSVYAAEIIEPTEEISFSAAGERYFYDAQSFFQGNLGLVEKLLATALQNAEGRTALDLYCGVGLFTLPLARRFEKVTGVESNEKAVAFAHKNIENARLENTEIAAQAVGEWLAENVSNLDKIDFVLLDPPRSGAERETIENLLKLKPKQISYISCEPSTLARDLRILTQFYEIESVTALDLFPQTHHVETVVRLKIICEL